ncbi:hypothetical protein C0Q70_04398 [Pomacea canaliculata]|uniref:Uncharacterized protein n=1 Tax=Pomacea canaliculata TaxID=400727 RepID=A0A2T7PVF4_POMCA|nr:hypothetical protein C0Q70_04398 [Pomacea canaliculata]
MDTQALSTRGGEKLAPGFLQVPQGVWQRSLRLKTAGPCGRAHGGLPPPRSDLSVEDFIVICHQGFVDNDEGVEGIIIFVVGGGDSPAGGMTGGRGVLAWRLPDSLETKLRDLLDFTSETAADT